MFSYYLNGHDQSAHAELTETEIHARLDELEERLTSILEGNPAQDLDTWTGDAYTDLSMISHLAGEELRRNFLPDIEVSSEDIGLAILEHRDLTARQLKRIAYKYPTIAVLQKIVTHPNCDPAVYASLGEHSSRHAGHKYLKTGRQKVLWDASPYGAASVALASLPARRFLLVEAGEHQARVEKLGAGGYEAVETFLTLAADKATVEQVEAEKHADELVEQALLLA